MNKKIIIDEDDWEKYIPTYMLHGDIEKKIRILTPEEIHTHCKYTCKKCDALVPCNLIKTIKGEK